MFLNKGTCNSIYRRYIHLKNSPLNMLCMTKSLNSRYPKIVVRHSWVTDSWIGKTVPSLDQNFCFTILHWVLTYFNRVFGISINFCKPFYEWINCIKFSNYNINYKPIPSFQRIKLITIFQFVSFSFEEICCYL